MKETLPDFLNTTTSNQDTGVLEQIKELVEKMIELEQMIGSREEVIAKLKSEHKLISESHLPSLFEQADIEEIKSSTGAKIKLSKTFVGNVKNPDSIKWLEENDLDSIIKNTFTVNFERGEESDAKQLESDLEALGVPFTRKEAIHPSTLKSFINERMEQDPEFPQTLFAVQQIARVKSTKTR